jgi:hypothetical protein
MVKVWQELFLRTEGLRLIFTIPQEFVNEVLPLSIDPEPSEIKRVFLWWLEISRKDE